MKKKQKLEEGEEVRAEKSKGQMSVRDKTGRMERDRYGSVPLWEDSLGKFGFHHSLPSY